MRVWVLSVALACFAAGMFAGVALPELFAGEQPIDPTRLYVDDLAERYGLSATQRRSVDLVLEDARRQELEILRGADWSQMPKPLQAQWLVTWRKTEERIRFVLDERQRALYDRDTHAEGQAAPVPLRRHDDR